MAPWIDGSILSLIKYFFFLIPAPAASKIEDEKKIAQSPAEERRSKTNKKKSDADSAAGLAFALPASKIAF